MHIYDYIIIGSGLTGLTIAKKIQQETGNILILEAQETAGGDNRPAKLNNQTIDNGIRFYPGSDMAKKSILFLQDLIGGEIAAAPTENHIETYEASGLKQFIGFGEKSPEFYDELSYFLNSHEQKLNVAPYQWVAQMIQELQSHIQTKSIVTKFGFEGLDSEKPKLTHIVVNGNKQIYAQNFIFAGAPKDLGLLIPDDVLNIRAKAKLKKFVGWQGVCLDLFHNNASKKSNMFLLNGTTDDDIGPLVGRFNGQISQWMSFVDSESAEDTENIGMVLKKMKRQIKRAFPDMADAIVKERIFVTPPLSGADLKLNANGTLPKVDNLWIASSQMSPYKNLLGSLTQAQMILTSLGFISDQKILNQEISANP